MTVTGSVLASYAGRYRVGSSDLLITIAHGGAGLQASAEGMPVMQLLPQSRTRFLMREDDTRFDYVVHNEKVTGGPGDVVTLWTLPLSGT